MLTLISDDVISSQFLVVHEPPFLSQVIIVLMHVLLAQELQGFMVSYLHACSASTCLQERASQPTSRTVWEHNPQMHVRRTMQPSQQQIQQVCSPFIP